MEETKYNLHELFIKDQKYICQNGDKSLEVFLEEIELYHKIKSKYTYDEIMELQELIELYDSYDNKWNLEHMCEIATNWWRDIFINPNFEEIKLRELLLFALTAKLYRNKYTNPIEVVDLLCEELKSRIKEQLILGNEINIDYPTIENNIIKESIIASNYKESNRPYARMIINKDEIKVIQDDKESYLYYFYQKKKYINNM